MRGFLFGALLLGCSASGETGAPSDRNDGGTSASGGSEQAGGAGLGGEATAGTSGGGSGGFAGAPDLCQAGDERLCSCAPTYGGKQTCSDFGWNLCVCPGWPPEGGAGGDSAGTGATGGSGGGPEPWLGRDCTFGVDTCEDGAPDGIDPTCIQGDGIAGGVKRPGYCTFLCANPDETCSSLSGSCSSVGQLLAHCVGN